MILHFPTIDVLRLALTSGAVPEEVWRAAVSAGFSADGQAWVQTELPIAKASLTELRRLGAAEAKSANVPLAVTVTCWPQLLPVERSRELPHITNKTPVLFELPNESQLADVVAEILRLGNDRQSFRWLTDAANGRALLRVIGPPYYALLRALDAVGSASAPVAFVERNPRVWIQIGYSHPLEEQLQPPPGKLLFLRPPRQWTLLDEAKFRDIYDVVEFALPDAPSAWQPAELPNGIRVPLRLARSGSTDPAELWVLQNRAIEQVDELVKNADDQLLHRLAFAVSERDGSAQIVLRVRPSKQGPPVLVLNGVGFRSYLRLPNLFLPCDARLHPPLRREAVGRLLANDPDRLVWLAPCPDSSFTPESLPENAFRPLEDWVDYVIDHEHVAVDAWRQSFQFDFEPFVCKDDLEEKPKKPREPERAPKGRKDSTDSEESAAAPTAPVKKAPRRAKADAFADLPKVEPSQLQQRLRNVEKQFLELKSPLDAPQRREMWREMALLNAALKNSGDATLCWANLLWESEQLSAEQCRAWLATAGKEMTTPEQFHVRLDNLLQTANPTSWDLCNLAAFLTWAGHADGVLNNADMVGRMAQYLERHENMLPVRAAWLAWLGLMRLSGGDILALARTRDRILQRLYQQGLIPQLDLPGFVRAVGGSGGEKLRQVREHLAHLRTNIRAWLDTGPQLGAKQDTVAYCDLMLAFGMASVGEAADSLKLLHEAEQVLTGRDLSHDWLVSAFGFRIKQAIDGQALQGRLPDRLLGELDGRERVTRFKADRLREHSRILEPQERIDPYRRWHCGAPDALGKELGTLCDLNDRAALSHRLEELLAKGYKGSMSPEMETRIVLTAMELAPRLGEGFATGLLDQAERVFANAGNAIDQVKLLEKSLFLAAHFDQAEQVQVCIARFHELLTLVEVDGKKRLAAGRLRELLAGDIGTETVNPLETLVSHSFRSLRKLGMRDAITQLLQRLANFILLGEALDDLGARFLKAAGGNKPQAQKKWTTTLKLLLHVAGGWFYFDETDRAREVLDSVRDLLLTGDLIMAEQTSLACAYVTALGQAPMEMALPRLDQLFRKLERVYDPFTTNTHYSLSRLDVVEATVLALISDDFRADKTSRRWLDDDEFLVRRRIHRDVRRAMAEE